MKASTLPGRRGADFLLAIGGGSVIDTAKAIGMGVPYDGDFWDFFTGKAKIEHTLPIGTVLTISAAGSEGSDSCVITQEDGNLKWGCPKTDLIRPKFSVLDPTYTYSLPDYQLACGAVDMLAHLCERYFTNTPDVALTDRLCEAVMKTIVDAAPKALADHSDYACPCGPHVGRECWPTTIPAASAGIRTGPATRSSTSCPPSMTAPTARGLRW